LCRSSCHSDLVISILCDISDPRESSVSTLFLDFKIPHLESTNCVIRNFEVQRNWLALELFSVWWNHCRKMESCCQEIFSLSWELLECPSNSFFIRDILDYSVSCFELWCISIIGDRNKHINIICSWFLLEITLNLDSKFNFIRIRFTFCLNIHLEQWFHSNIQSIRC